MTSKFAAHNMAQVSKDASGIFTTLNDTLNDVNDPASAEAALPKLREVSRQLDDLQHVRGQMSPGGQSMLAKIIRPRRNRRQANRHGAARRVKSSPAAKVKSDKLRQHAGSIPQAP
jgi:hypothetical protein